MSILGAILKGKKVGQKLLRAHRIKHGKRSPDIKTLKPLSGKIPWYVGAGGKDPARRANIVKTHFSLKRSRKIDKAAEDVKRGKEKLKKLVDTGQAEELKDYKGKGTGKWHKKGFE